MARPFPEGNDRCARSRAHLWADFKPALGPKACRLAGVPPDTHDGPLTGRTEQIDVLTALVGLPERRDGRAWRKPSFGTDIEPSLRRISRRLVFVVPDAPD
jgi:hypothetical protein